MTPLPPHIRIASTPLPDTPRTRRRQAEQEAVRRLICTLFGHEASYCHRSDGTPYVEGATAYISVSHGAGCATVAVSTRGPVGIDIECWRHQLLRIAPRFLDPDELPRFTSPEQLLQAWTAKEAAFKAAGMPGLTLACIHLDSPSEALLPDGRRLRVYHRGNFPTIIAVAELF